MRRPIRVLAVLMLCVAAAACGDSNDTTPTSPTPTPITVTENYADTLTPNGARTYAFTTQTSGSVTATLTTLAADSGVTVGVSLGTWNGSACQTIIANDQAAQATVVTGTVTGSGSLCARVYDAIGLAGPVDYELTVVHP